MYTREQFGESETRFLKLCHADFYYSFLLSRLLVAKLLCKFEKNGHNKHVISIVCNEEYVYTVFVFLCATLLTFTPQSLI